MGGFAGRFVIDEFVAGSCGTMPACEVDDVHVAIWRALEAGDIDSARDLHARALPLLNIEYLYGPAIYKEVLRLPRDHLDQSPFAIRAPRTSMRATARNWTRSSFGCATCSPSVDRSRARGRG